MALTLAENVAMKTAYSESKDKAHLQASRNAAYGDEHGEAPTKTPAPIIIHTLYESRLNLSFWHVKLNYAPVSKI